MATGRLVVEFACPHCGARLHADPSALVIACSGCRRAVEVPVDRDVFAAPAPAVPAPAPSLADPALDGGWSDRRTSAKAPARSSGSESAVVAGVVALIGLTLGGWALLRAARPAPAPPPPTSVVVAPPTVPAPAPTPRPPRARPRPTAAPEPTVGRVAEPERPTPPEARAMGPDGREPGDPVAAFETGAAFDRRAGRPGSFENPVHGRASNFENPPQGPAARRAPNPDPATRPNVPSPEFQDPPPPAPPRRGARR